MMKSSYKLFLVRLFQPLVRKIKCREVIIQWVEMMYVWSVREGKDFSSILIVVTFLHARGRGLKYVW